MDGIEKNGNIDLPKRFNNTTSVLQMYTIILKDKKSRDDLQEYLLANDVKSKVYFMPVHKQEVYKLVYVDAYCVELPMTEHMSDRVLSIPIYPDITADELAKITYTINKFFAVR